MRRWLSENGNDVMAALGAVLCLSALAWAVGQGCGRGAQEAREEAAEKAVAMYEHDRMIRAEAQIEVMRQRGDWPSEPAKDVQKQ